MDSFSPFFLSYHLWGSAPGPRQGGGTSLHPGISVFILALCFCYTFCCISTRFYKYLYLRLLLYLWQAKKPHGANWNNLSHR